MKKAGLLISGVLLSSSAVCSALTLDLGVGAGRQFGDEGYKYKADEYRATALFQISNLPLSAGLSFGYLNYDRKDEENEFEQRRIRDSYVADLSAEIKAWVPASLTGSSIKPYGKFSHSLLSSYKKKFDRDGLTFKQEGNADSYRVGAGIELSFLDSFGVFGEYTYTRHSIRITEKQPDNVREKENIIRMTRGFLIGATARI